ncbi:DUF3284 domain-containing protein [Lactiplantibacillus carotarum]|uniref:DUF3284 domain-containing protein n=1 Tax=Lactiplantibacillus carotarum TaxID=2993456 RepID=UPI00298EE2A1|nr:DUF3284 domain-containing protein [Lactiplantibacillus carotarum]
MKYSYKLTAPAAAVFEILIAEQTSYYRRFLPKLHTLAAGTEVQTKLPTKLNKLPVEASIKVTEIEASQSFVQETTSASGTIQQAYRLEEKGGQTVLVYEERNFFKKALAQSSYGITGLFYHFVFNMRAKKRARYLDEKAQALVSN